MLSSNDKSKWVRLAYHIIPDNLVDNLETQLKSVILVITLFGITGLSIILVPVLLVFFPEVPAISEGGIILISFCMGFYLTSFFVLNRFGALNTAGNITLAGIYIGTLISSWATGGIYSPLMYTLFIPPVYAFIITNLASAWTWAAITLLTFVGVWAVDELALIYPAMEKYESLQVIINAADATTLTLIMPIASLLAILLVVTSYELSSNKMKKMLTQEKNMFAFKASHDPLTGLGNRAEFDNRLKVSIDAAGQSEQRLALAYIDLDGFKPINDNLGHHAGDIVLKTLSNRLSSAIRGTDMIARLGGDEFAIILHGVGENTAMKPLIEKILNTIAQDIEIDDGQIVNVSGSIGIAYYPVDATTPDRLCRYADMAMYRAKEEKNTWRVYKPEI